MNAGMTELLAFALVVIIIVLFLLIGIVRELVPTERGKCYLGIGLGAGVIAFSLKIGLIVFFSLFPGSMPAQFPERVYKRQSVVVSSVVDPGSYTGSVAYTWEVLPGSAPYPLNNPPSPEKIALGKKLFFDKRLSADGSLSCVSCHELSVAKGGGDGHNVAVGINGQQGKRNVPTVINAAFQRHLFWDGRVTSLEEQAKGPLINPIEMGMPSLDSVVDRVKNITEYKILFKQTYVMEPSITINNIVKAIATYERTLITPDSPYDRFVKGDNKALTKKQIRGMALFESMGCILCHSGPNFSSASVFGNYSPYRFFPVIAHTDYELRYELTEDLGLANASMDVRRGIWRVPSLRNVSRTSPYFHNGSVKSLKDAVRIMASVQLAKRLSNKIVDDTSIQWMSSARQLNVSTNLAISDNEVDEIVAFLEALNGELPTAH